MCTQFLEFLKKVKEQKIIIVMQFVDVYNE